MTGSISCTQRPLITDDELAALALAADPDMPVPRDAVSIWDLDGARADQPLPEWYMPAPRHGLANLGGWRRRIVTPIIVSFLTITAFGLCNTYGQLGFG